MHKFDRFGDIQVSKLHFDVISQIIKPRTNISCLDCQMCMFYMNFLRFKMARSI